MLWRSAPGSRPVSPTSPSLRSPEHLQRPGRLSRAPFARTMGHAASGSQRTALRRARRAMQWTCVGKAMHCQCTPSIPQARYASVDRGGGRDGLGKERGMGIDVSAAWATWQSKTRRGCMANNHQQRTAAEGEVTGWVATPNDPGSRLPGRPPFPGPARQALSHFADQGGDGATTPMPPSQPAPPRLRAHFGVPQSPNRLAVAGGSHSDPHFFRLSGALPKRNPAGLRVSVAAGCERGPA